MPPLDSSRYRKARTPETAIVGPVLASRQLDRELGAVALNEAFVRGVRPRRVLVSESTSASQEYPSASDPAE